MNDKTMAYTSNTSGLQGLPTLPSGGAAAADIVAGIPVPTLDDIAAEHMALAPWVTRTPHFEKNDFVSLEDTQLHFKLELLQYAGTFKTRAAYSNMLALNHTQRSMGVTCASAGNHAVAVAYAAMRLGISAKIVVTDGAIRSRTALAEHYGADVVVVANANAALDEVERIVADEGRTFLSPFHGYRTVLGTATLGYEWATQASKLDAVIVPIGGGLAAGMSIAFRLTNPDCRVFGVEPRDADALARSIMTGEPVRTGTRASFDERLAPNDVGQYSYELCRRHLDRVVTVTDAELGDAMLRLFDQLKMAVEPSCAAPLAALLGPLRRELTGKRVGIVLSGSNTDPDVYSQQLLRAYAERSL